MVPVSRTSRSGKGKTNFHGNLLVGKMVILGVKNVVLQKSNMADHVLRQQFGMESQQDCLDRRKRGKE